MQKEKITDSSQIKIGDYVRIYSPEWVGWATAKCIETPSGKAYLVHNTRIILDEDEIEEFGCFTEKPTYGTEYDENF